MSASSPFTHQVKVKTSHYLIGGFALATALSFNTFVRSAIDYVYPTNGGSQSLWALGVYSCIMVLLLVLLIHVLPSTTEELPTKVREKLSNYEDPSVPYVRLVPPYNLIESSHHG